MRPIGEVRRIARAEVKTALAFPEGAQVGTAGLDVPDALLVHRCRQKSAAVGLQLQPDAGAPMAAVVPFQCYDAAAGTKVCGLLSTLRLAEACQQQRIRPEPVCQRAVYTGSIIQDFGRMFHREVYRFLSKISGKLRPEFVQKQKAADPL